MINSRSNSLNYDLETAPKRSDLTKVICPEQSLARAMVSDAKRTDKAESYFSFR